MAISVSHHGRVTRLKWHRARKHLTDPVFTGGRILEGMTRGACVEVDLQRHGAGGFAILHDFTLDRETDGTGPVAGAGQEALRRLRLRHNDGSIGNEPLMLLEDLSEQLDGQNVNAQASLQLDLKNQSDELTAQDIGAFVRAVGPFAGTAVLSGGDAVAVRRLSEEVADLTVGFDPCYDSALLQLIADKDYNRFVETSDAALPNAVYIYLHHKIVSTAADDGVNLVAAFQERGKKIDAYTIKAATSDTLPILRRLLSLGVDQITTDDPAGVETALKSDM